MTFINKNNVLSAENINVISFRDFRNFRKMLNIQSINIIMNNKSTQNTQENVVNYSFIEFSGFHAILQYRFSIKSISLHLNKRNIILDRTYFRTLYIYM